MPNNINRQVELAPYDDRRRAFFVNDADVAVAGILRARPGGINGVTVDVEFTEPVIAAITHNPRGASTPEQALSNDRLATQAVRDGLLGLIEIFGYKPY